MSLTDILALLPYLIIAGTAVAAMLAVAFFRNHLFTAAVCIGGLILALVSLPAVASLTPRRVTGLLLLDQYAFFFLGLMIAAGIGVAVFAYGYLKERPTTPEEFYLVLPVAICGAGVLAAAVHFVSLFLGLEILSVSLYVLVAYRRVDERGIEAAVKYLVTAAVSSAFLLFGMALLYAELGTMELAGLVGRAAAAGERSMVFTAGAALIMTGLGFKLALVPFHLWTPDVYEGAPAPVTAFIATVSKGAVFALLLRWFGGTAVRADGALFAFLAAIAALSMLAGNLLALLQENVKRLLAYSSIAHLGYLLVAFLASGPLITAAVTFYLTAYFITTLGAFGIVTLLSDGSGEAESLARYRSLAWKHPWLACVFTAMLLSLAGIPLTAGFVGKFIVAAAGVQSSLWLLVIILVVSSAIGLFYYLRVIAVMFAQSEGGSGGGERPATAAFSPAGQILLALLFLLLLWLGIYPGTLLAMLQRLAFSQ